LADVARRSEPIQPARLLVGVIALVATIVILGLAWFAIAGTGRLEVPNLSTQPQLVGHLLLASAVLLATVGLLHDAEGYLAGTWIVSTMGPWIAAAVGIGTYILTDGWAQDTNVRFAAAYNGIAAAVAAIAGLAFLGRQLSRPDRAQPRTWESLVDRQVQLQARLEGLKADKLLDPTLTQEADKLMAAVTTHLCEREAWTPALRWALATGYSSVQRTLHRLDEIVVTSQPSPGVTGDALHDALSLTGSTIADRDVLSARLRTALQTISPSSARYFLPRTNEPASPSARVLDDPPSDLEARAVLREVRYAINEFRDDRVDGLIRARNRLLWVVLTVGITAYLALALALLDGVGDVQISTIAVLYLVAALAGLLNRLRIESGRSSAIEDYGLHLARLIATPLLSGLAGVAGVYLVANTPELLTVVNPVAVGAATPDLAKIFDLGSNQSALLVAAIFGLVPSQLFSGLTRQADRFQADLEKSAPAGESTLSTPPT
jgi:hypothetical protein